MKTVPIVFFGDTRTWMKPWIDQIETHLPVRLHYLRYEAFCSHTPESFDRVIFIGKSLFLSRENLADICAPLEIDPLRVYVYPEEDLPFSPEDNQFDQWSSFVDQVIQSSEPESQVEIISLQPLKKVALLGEKPDESIIDVFHRQEIETCIPDTPFTIERQGIQYLLKWEDKTELVGAVVVIPDFQNIFSFHLPPEAEETRKIVFINEFQTKVRLRSFRQQTVVFFVPETIVPVETWSLLYDLSRLLVERDQSQVYIFCREAVVAADGLESKYRSCRKAGVIMEKIDFSALSIKPTLDMRGNWINLVTERDGFTQKIMSDWIVKVPGKKTMPYDLSSVLKGDRLIPSLTRTENINLFPYMFPLDGWFELPDNAVTSDTQYALHGVIDYIQKGVRAEKGRAFVDEEKCVLCLTCVRTCPWSAIDIDGMSKRRKARINWEQCHLCGLCASSCPAGAITLIGITEASVS